MAASDGVDSSIMGWRTKISYRDKGGQLKPFSPRTVASIVGALAKSKLRLSFTRRNNESFRVDLKRMKRISMDSGLESDIIVEICSEVAIEKIKGKFGRRELLSTLLEELCSVDFFRSTVVERASPYKISSIRENPHAGRGSQLYSRFLDALEKKANELPGLLGEIVELVLQRRGLEEDSSIQYAFHGTPPGNLSSICEKGMDPHLRKYKGDYFGVKATTSLEYSSTNYSSPSYRSSLLVFILILPGLPGHPSLKGIAHRLVVETSHELPIAVVDLDLNLPS